MRRLTFTFVALSIPLFAGSARADTTSLLGPDPETAAALGSDVADGRAIGVLQVNPALLVGVEERAHVGFFVAMPRAQVRLLPRPHGTDVSRSIYDSSVSTSPGAEDRAIPTSELRNPRTDTVVTSSDGRMAFGFVSSFGASRIRFGALAVVPFASGDAANVTTHYDDEHEGAFSNRLTFLRFGQSDRVAAVTLGAGVRIFDWLSVGGGVRLAATAIARLAVYVPDASVQDHSESNLETSVATSWRPILGVRAEPVPGLSLGLAWRAESSFTVHTESEVALWNDHDEKGQARRTTMVIPLVFGWQPQELSVGVAWKGLRAAATHERWSHYLDGHSVSPEDGAAIAGKNVDTSAYRFHDVVSFAGSATVPATKWLEFTAGVTYRPTPVPAQTGRTSFVDSSILGFSLGERAKFSVTGRRFVLSLTAQLFRLLPRTTFKDPNQTVDAYPDDARTLRGGQSIPEAKGLQTNSPGFPGFHSEGWLLSASVSIAWLFG
ncbi:MAG: OmpP1/FadL family transporter [Polyangiales bacterium]